MAPTDPAARRAGLTPALLDLAQLGIAQWLFGNVYEAVVRIPERLSARNSDAPGTHGSALPRSVLGRGSPVRYYAPAAPITAATILTALVLSRQTRSIRRWLGTAAGCMILGSAITGYLVRTVNLKLFFGSEPVPAAERDALIRRWYRLNVLRTVATGAALFAAHRARQASARKIPSPRGNATA
jgi:hypothetical protein